MPPSRHEAIRTLDEGHAELARAFHGLTDEQMVRPATVGGGDWSFKDLIGHIGAWELRALDALDTWRVGEPIQALIGIRAVDELNARNVAASRRRSLERVRRDADLAHRRLVERIDRLSEREWSSLATMSTGRRHRLSTLLGSITAGPAGPFAHVFAHLPDVHA